MTDEGSSGNKRGPKPGADSLKTHRTELDELRAEIAELKAFKARMPEEYANTYSLGNVGQRVAQIETAQADLNEKMDMGAGGAMLRRIEAIEGASQGPFAGMKLDEVVGAIAIGMAAAVQPKGASLDPQRIVERLQAMMAGWDIWRRISDGETAPWVLKREAEKAQAAMRAEEARNRVENVEHGTGKTEDEIAQEREPELATVGAPPEKPRVSKVQAAMAAAGVSHIKGGPPAPPGGGRRFGG